MRFWRLYRFFRNGGARNPFRAAYQVWQFADFMRSVEIDSIERWKRKRKASRGKHGSN